MHGCFHGNEHNSPCVQTSDQSCKMSKPWYYVHGRKDLIEKRICNKREADSRKRQSAIRHHNHCQDIRSQAEWFGKKVHNKIGRSEPPFGYDQPEGQDTSTEVIRNLESQLKLSIKKLMKWETFGEKLKKRSSRIASYLSFLVRCDQDLLAMIHDYEDTLNSVERHRPSFRNKLIIHSFVMIQMQELMKKALHQMVIQSKSLGTSHREWTHLNSLFKGSSRILQHLISSNRVKNGTFLSLYQ